MKRSHIAGLIIFIASIVTTSAILYEMHNTKRISQVMLADDKIMASDGGGFYLVPDTMRVVHESNYIVIDMRQSTQRHVQINFLHTKWKDDGLREGRWALTSSSGDFSKS